MKKIVSIIIAFLLCAPFAVAQQQEPESKPNIAETIQQESAGQIIIDIPEELQKELFEEPAVKSAPNPGASANRGNRGQSSAKKPGKITTQGFRIQIFGDGRNQATLKSRASARANAVCSRFPQYRGQVYSFSKAPNWYTRVGNFKTREEANRALMQLKRAFPAFASEMRVVKSSIVPSR